MVTKCQVVAVVITMAAFSSHAVSGSPPAVRLTLPNTGDQKETWTCGPNSAARVLAYYGHNVDHAKLVSVTQRGHGILPSNSTFSRYKTGTEPHELREVMKRWEKGNVKLTRKAEFEDLKSLANRGIPVVVLLRVGSIKPAGIFSGTWPEMHWVVVSGIDAQKKTLWVTNTNSGGCDAEWTFDEFMSKWNWSIGTGLASEVLHRKGVHTRTMIWVDRVMPPK